MAWTYLITGHEGYRGKVETWRIEAPSSSPEDRVRKMERIARRGFYVGDDLIAPASIYKIRAEWV